MQMFVYFYKLLSNCFYSNNNFISKGQIDHVEINGRKNYCNCMYMTWNLFLLLALGHYYIEANFALKMRNISFYKSLQLLVLLKIIKQFKNVCFKNQSLIHSIQHPMKFLNLTSAKKIQAYIFKIIIFVFENIL